MIHRSIRKWTLSLTTFVVILTCGTFAFAKTAKVEGLVKSKRGDTITIQTASSSKVTVQLSDRTQIVELHGAFNVVRKDVSQEKVVPGLRIRVEGTLNEQQQVVAKSVKFDAKDLEDARAIQAGVFETQVLAQQNKEELVKQNDALQAQSESLKAQQEQLIAQQQQMAAQQQEIQKNRAVIDAAIARFGQLEQYYILDEVTVLFKNGQSKVDPKYMQQLDALAERAKTIKGYTIQVEGYASAVGSTAVNQKLSERRAENVKAVLLQEGEIPTTNILSPGAMGQSRQIGDPKTPKGEAENRRVVVRVLQSKGNAGV